MLSFYGLPSFRSRFSIWIKTRIQINLEDYEHLQPWKNLGKKVAHIVSLHKIFADLLATNFEF